MHSASEIVLPLFLGENIEAVGDLVLDEDSRNVYAQIKITFGVDGTRKPTRKQLLSVQQKAAEQGYQLSFLLVSDAKTKFEELIRETLFLAFPDVLRNVFCSLNEKGATVWIEPKSELMTSTVREIENSARNFCEAQHVALVDCFSIADQVTPGKLAILSALRLVAPVSSDGLKQALESTGFNIPSQDWLHRKLDALRKSGVVSLTSNRNYCLPGQTLRVLGTSKNGMTSPDVTRLLALWRSRA